MELLTDELIREAVENFKEKMFQSLGQASMCWAETPKGIFKSDEAKKIGDELILFLESKIRQAVDSGYKYGVKSVVEELSNIVDDGISCCKEDSKNNDIVGKELHYVFGKSQALKIIKLNLENIKHENDTSDS